MKNILLITDFQKVCFGVQNKNCRSHIIFGTGLWLIIIKYDKHLKIFRENLPVFLSSHR